MYSVKFVEYIKTDTQLTGTVNIFAGQTYMSGGGTSLFTTELSVGDKVMVGSSPYTPQIREVDSIVNDSGLHVTTAWSFNRQGADYYKIDENFNTVYQIPVADIIDIQLSANELESEEPLFRTPVSAVIKANMTNWLRDNIINMPRNNLITKGLCKYIVQIEWNSTIIATMFIDNEQISNKVESGICEIQCYDITKLLEIFDDEDATIGHDYYHHAFLGALNVLRNRILDKTGFPEYLFDITDNSEIDYDFVDGLETTNLNWHPDEIFEETTISGDNIPIEALDSVPMGYATRPFLKRYRVGFSLPNVQSDHPDNFFGCPAITGVALEIWEAYDVNNLIDPDTGELYYRPMYYVRLTIRKGRFYNLSSYQQEKDEVHVAGWQYGTPRFVIDSSAPGGKRPPTYEEIIMIGVDAVKHQTYVWVDRENAKWHDLKDKYWQEIRYILGTSQSALNTHKFRDVEPSFSTHWTASLAHQTPCTITHNITNESEPLLWENIIISLTGRSIPGRLNFRQGSYKYLDLIKIYQKVYNVVLYSLPSGGYGIASRHTSVEYDPLDPPTDIPNNSIELLTTTLKGRKKYKDLKLSLLPGDYALLEQRLSTMYNTVNPRKQLSIMTTDLDGIGDLLDVRTIKDTYLGYIVSQQVNYLSQKAEIKIDITEKATLEFTVTQPAPTFTPIENANVSLELNPGMYVRKMTDASGKATYYNVPVRAEEYNYKITKAGYSQAIGTFLIDDEDDFFKSVILNHKIPQPPIIQPVFNTNKPTQVFIKADSDAHKIYYSDDGVDPEVGNPNTYEYEKPFYIYANKTIKAIAVTELDEESAVESEAIESNPDIPTPTVHRLYDDEDKDYYYIGVEYEKGVGSLRYTLDGSEPDDSSPEYSSILRLPKSLEIKEFKCKLFWYDDYDYYSDTVTYIKDDGVELERQGKVGVSADESEEFILDLATYQCKITVLVEMYHSEEISSQEVDVLLTAVRTFDARFANLSAHGAGEFWGDILSLEETNAIAQSSAGVYGRINRFVARVYDSGVDISINVPYVPIEVFVAHAGGNLIELRVRIENALNLATGICDDLDDPTVTYKIKVEPMRLIPEPYTR